MRRDGSTRLEVEADAKHTADAITKELKQFFAEEGWIARP